MGFDLKMCGLKMCGLGFRIAHRVNMAGRRFKVWSLGLRVWGLGCRM